MKRLILISIILSNYIYVFGQRNFSVDSLDERNLYLTNLATDSVTVIPTYGLIKLAVATPERISLGFLETGRCKLLRLGLWAISETQQINKLYHYECKCQIEAQYNKVGYWQNYLHESFSNGQKYERVKPFVPIQTRKRPFASVVGKPLDEESNVFPQPIVEIIELKYTKTNNDSIYFENKKNFKSFVISKKGYLIDYKRIIDISFSTLLDLRTYLITMGSIAIKYPAHHKIKKERNAMFLAQRKKIGVWHNYDGIKNIHGDFLDTIPPKSKNDGIIKPDTPVALPWYKKIFAVVIKWWKSKNEVDKFFFRTIGVVVIFIFAFLFIKRYLKMINNQSHSNDFEKSAALNAYLGFVFCILGCIGAFIISLN